MNHNKFKLYFAVALVVVAILPIIALLIPKNVKSFKNAMVNPQNGDIAIVYFDHNNGGKIDLHLYDVNGTLLFIKSHESSGGSHSKISFVGDDIHIYISRTNISYSYGRNGESVNALSQEKWNSVSSEEWIGWSSKYGSKTYEMGNYIYYYEQTPYPKSLISSKCSMIIKNIETQKVVQLLELE